MINLAINGSITKSSVYASGKATPAAAEKQANTFQDILRETVYNKSAANEMSALYNANDTFSAADTDDEIADYTEEIETVEEPIYAPEPQRAKTLDEITRYVEIEINGRWVKQVTDEFLTYVGYNVEILKANDLNENLLKHIDEDGFVPKYVIPLDMGRYTDYAKTLATPENLSKTTANNAALGSMASKSVDVLNNKPITLSSAQKSFATPENLSKTTANNAALRILSNLNILNIWESKEKEDEKNNSGFLKFFRCFKKLI